MRKRYKAIDRVGSMDEPTLIRALALDAAGLKATEIAVRLWVTAANVRAALDAIKALPEVR